MKFSQMSLEELYSLSPEKKTDIIFGKRRNDDRVAEAALVLGGMPERCGVRADAAAQLYLEGKVKYLIPTGGVEWDFGGRLISEARYLTERMLEKGVPEKAILVEDDARTTAENMILASLCIARNLKLKNTKSVYVVTSEWHLERSLALAKCLLPRSVEILEYAAQEPEILREDWFLSEKGIERIDKEIRLLKGLVDNGLVDDIEI